MRLVFTKRAGRNDELAIHGPDGAPQVISCPKQGIIPHDLVHYAVESVLHHRGFLSLVADGRTLAFTTTGGESEETAERLVEVFQAEMWGSRVADADLLDTYVHACACRGHSAFPLAIAEVSAIRARLDDLTSRWERVRLNGSLSLDFRPA